MKFSCVALPLLLLAGPGRVLGHPEIDDQIRYLSELIERDSEGCRAEMFLARGELLSVHREWDGALSDFEQAEALNPTFIGVHLSRGRLYREKGEPRRAIAELDKFLEAEPGDSPALMVRARSYRDLEDFENADHDYAAAIRLSESPRPEMYLERVRILKESGRADAFERSLAVLDEGLDRLGPLAALQLPAIEMERSRGNIDEALERIDLLDRTGGNAVKRLELRGDVLVEAGREFEAGAAYSEALRGFSQLSPRQQSLAPLQRMKAEIESALGALNMLSAVEAFEARKEQPE